MSSLVVAGPLPAPRVRAARLAVFVLFFANGAASASLIPRLPAIKAGLSLTNAQLGAAVAAMPVGGLIAGGLVGIVVARAGSGRVAVTAGLLEMAGLAALGLAPSWAALAAAYFVMGVFDAAMDASMNTHAVGVERVYGRSILQGSHGGWSAGSMVAGMAGALAAWAGVPVAVHLALVAAALAIGLLAVSRSLLPTSIADRRLAPVGAAALRIHPRNAPRLVRVLLPIAMLGILCATVQTAGSTWSAVFGTDVLGLSAGIAALGYVLYSAAMTVSRLVNDRWVDRLGATRFVQIGAALSLVAVLAVMGSATLGLPALAFAGFAAIGIGTSPMFPVMVRTAGSRPGIPAAYGVSLVSWMVRVGLILAPALIGAAADALGLATALWIPAVVALLILLLAPAMTAARSTPREESA